MKSIVKFILLVLNMLFALGMLMGKAATIIEPLHFSVFAYCGLAFPFLLAANIVFFIFWIVARKWKWTLITLITSLICINNIGNTFPIHLVKHSVSPSSPILTVMSYNIDAFGQYAPHKEDRIGGGLLSYINGKQPDVVCLQEFFVYKNSKNKVSEKNIVHLLSNLPYHYIHYSLHAEKSNEGLAIFSKYPIVNHGVCRFSKGYYTTIFADINVDGAMIRIFDHHMESNKFSLNDRKHYADLVSDFSAEQFHNVALTFSTKMNEAYGLRAKQSDTVATAIVKSPYPVIVCGDFNDVPVSYTYTTIKGKLIDTFAAVGSGYGNTYSSKFFPFRIDYIMCDPKFHPVWSHVDKVHHSDHYPILSGISL
ncbi:endonuclease/exonuclease/phosphatase family protein [Microbacter margulisiae]|uniref:Endonuclease/exonuclease/phosphatase family metal-dependent hydrolase n=1 Tax=Microbacter margulisiae TaxID=1350067 RepID=A0A7W5H3F4_9PORP|nr:endonuclease/exonuclease/phosphatase family protein [Microbacter margulisiae]MBB3188554.1 endonuclease/exonuclease/phosphatase family metal-dependent hydrolase [Microbacter margulisiae]